MKFSFSIPSKPLVSRPPISNPPESFNPSCVGDDAAAAKVQFVTVFDPSEKATSNGLPVIPSISNADWANKKTKNLPLPTADDEASCESRFVLDTSDKGSDETGANRYGLLLRSIDAEERGVHMLDKQEDRMKRRIQEDKNDIPDEELPDVPVEGFGTALLAGYGWFEGKGIGRIHQEDSKSFKYKGNSGTRGFGYVPQAPTIGKKSQKEEIAAGFKSVNEKNEDKVGRQEWKSKSRGREKRNTDKRRDESSREEKKIKYGLPPSDDNSPIHWLRSHIKVRIISKKFAGGKFYLKKGEVVDVVCPTTCDIMVDGSKELLQGVDQEILETALPKLGGSVLVLYGKHKGVFGSLVERDSEKETGLVRDAESHSLIKVLLEQIAEYVGDPSSHGH